MSSRTDQKHRGATEIVTPALLRDWPLPSGAESKHSRGHILVVGGARRTPGGALLSGLAALRVGGGVLTMLVAESVAIPLAVAVPEAGVIGIPETDRGSVRGDGLANLDELGVSLDQANVLLIGPGLDNPTETSAVLQELARQVGPDVPVVLDAYALGVLADLPQVAATLAGRLWLTPNGEEARRLSGSDSDDPEQVAVEIAGRYQAVVSYSGVVADPEGGRWKMSTGHSGLATAGSGDVLAGALAGLLARGTPGAQAACWATHLHAAAGDRLSARVGTTGFLARELLAELPVVISELQV